MPETCQKDVRRAPERCQKAEKGEKVPQRCKEGARTMSEGRQNGVGRVPRRCQEGARKVP